MKKHGVDMLIKQNKLINSMAIGSNKTHNRHLSMASNVFKEPMFANLLKQSKDQLQMIEHSIDSTKIDLEHKG